MNGNNNMSNEVQSNYSQQPHPSHSGNTSSSGNESSDKDKDAVVITIDDNTDVSSIVENLTTQQLVKLHACSLSAIEASQKQTAILAALEVEKVCNNYGTNINEVQETLKKIEYERNVKFRDDKNNSWTGRGKKPKWIIDYLNEGGHIDDLKADNSQYNPL